MAAMTTPVCDFGWKAIDFRLEGTDGAFHTLADCAGERGTLVMFLCNHCPFVKAVIDRIVQDVDELARHGIGAVAIMPNDTQAYPADSFDNMKQFGADNGFGFPYLIDRTQEIARAYDAVCTPDFFGFDSSLGLQYRGRLDASRMEPVDGARRELLEAMIQVAETGRGPRSSCPPWAARSSGARPPEPGSRASRDGMATALTEAQAWRISSARSMRTFGTNAISSSGGGGATGCWAWAWWRSAARSPT